MIQVTCAALNSKRSQSDNIIYSDLKVHYATFLQAVNKQKNRVLDARKSSLQKLT